MGKPISQFKVIILGIIFNPTEKKILIARKEDDPNGKGLGWCFPGGKLEIGEDIDHALKKKIKLKTGYTIKNIGTFFSRTYDENPNIVSISFLTKVYEGKEAPGDDVIELKWVTPEEIEQHFKIPIHRKLKEFLSELV